MHESRSTDEPASYFAVGEDGSRRRLPIGRWLRDALHEEERLLDRASGPVLDIGCGAGRHLAALGRRGIDATGIEVSSLAVEIAREQDATVIHDSIFDCPAVPDWNTILLLDGNVGIGGDPHRLFARATEFLRPGGQVLVELEPPPCRTMTVNLRLESPGHFSEWFPWAWVGTDKIEPIAWAAGLDLTELWTVGQRCFAELRLASSK